MSNKINAEVKAKVNEIFAWCLENHDSEGFCVFVQVSGHVDLIEVHGYADGWEQHKDRLFDFAAYLNDGKNSMNKLNKIFTELKTIKAKYDAENTPEAKAEREEKAKQERIAKLKAELGELEGDSHE